MGTVRPVEATRIGPDDGAPAPVLPVFVYGTLRPGRANWPVAAPLCERTEPATLPGFALYDLDYPAVVEVLSPVGPEPSASVRGDLLRLAEPGARVALDHLDRFEGFVPHDPDRSYYRRVERPVVLADGTATAAWVYVPGADLLAQVDPARRVPGDDWPSDGRHGDEGSA
jgi:gamma-glutamylcyclotransferase (GGCT)/AIG2-like uncharacterized protein YtfP